MIPQYKMEWYIKFGFSTRQIEKMTGESKSNIEYAAKKYGMNQLWEHQQKASYNFEKIDDPGKAYALGFILCDGSIDLKKNVVLHIAERDKCVLFFISKVIGSEVHISYKTDIEKKLFPSARTQRKIKDISKFIAGDKKEERHFPRVREDLELYLMLGVFDADGCLSWGRRKDRNNTLWFRVSITSQYKILYGVQQMLYNKLGIPSIIHPRSKDKCFDLSINKKEHALKFLDWLYQNPYAVVLPRKYEKYKALRRELEDIGEYRD